MSLLPVKPKRRAAVDEAVEFIRIARTRAYPHISRILARETAEVTRRAAAVGETLPALRSGPVLEAFEAVRSARRGAADDSRRRLAHLARAAEAARHVREAAADWTAGREGIARG
ncbi:unnamed protein product [Phytomonas sp. Hart1]|nr:unnamed protein product [Phytomonas sp. Hart1]|eukprot:CCW69097.1 unnamed protein product [Phytomonas sp. isolate Hart1]